MLQAAKNVGLFYLTMIHNTNYDILLINCIFITNSILATLRVANLSLGRYSVSGTGSVRDSVEDCH